MPPIPLFMSAPQKAEAIAPPATYADWVKLLDDLKEKTDDDAVLEAMQKGTLEWQSGVAERFARKLVDAVNHRLNGATDRFQKEMGRCRGEERVIVQAIYSLRRELSFLSKTVDLPAIPEKDRKKYRELVIEQADKIQKSLEDSAKRDRTGKLYSIVKNNRVNAI